MGKERDSSERPSNLKCRGVVVAHKAVVGVEKLGVKFTQNSELGDVTSQSI